ncbi:MAG: endonuclease [Nitrospinota bacterium]|nr:endonuclease [Nitrospinota bacterium]
MRCLVFLLIILINGIGGFFNSGYSQELDRSKFQPSSLVSRETAEKQLNRIYQLAGKLRTFHCGCVFDKIKQVFPNICANDSKVTLEKKTSRTLEWVSMMPIHIFGEPLRCWTKNLCARSNGLKAKGAQCCSEVSPKFKKMESDMHNIFPVVNNLTSIDENFDFGGMWEYQFCSGESPSLNIRGDIARAYFYMSYQYKISLSEDLEDLMRKWHFDDPPDKWEERRNDRIEGIQGNRNLFIDHPEWTERVVDF